MARERIVSGPICIITMQICNPKVSIMSKPSFVAAKPHETQRIVLHVADLTDNNERRDAGSTLIIGEDIQSERAVELIAKHRASDPDAPVAETSEG
jgi:hypothetical protein